MNDTDWRSRAAAVPDAAREPARLARDLALEVFSHACESYPEECCGLLLGPPGGAPLEVIRCTNVQNQRLARGESDLDARRAFWIDEVELHRALRDADAREHVLRVVYHSHIDTGAYLSHTDLQGALGPDGMPLYTGAAQLVVAVSEAVVREAALYEWDAAGGCYQGRVVEGPD